MATSGVIIWGRWDKDLPATVSSLSIYLGTSPAYLEGIQLAFNVSARSSRNRLEIIFNTTVQDAEYV